MNLGEVFSRCGMAGTRFFRTFDRPFSPPGKIIRAPIENQFGRLIFSGNPHVDIAIEKFIADTRPELEVNLKSHPFVCDIPKTVSLGWKIALTGCLRIETVRRGPCVLKPPIAGGITLLEWIVAAMRGRAAAGIVQLHETALVGILGPRLPSQCTKNTACRVDPPCQ